MPRRKGSSLVARCLSLLLLLLACAAATAVNADRISLRGVPAVDTVYNDRNSKTDDLTIFISLASFRDPWCMGTVRDMYKKAVNPRRIFIGNIEQNEHGDSTCIPNEFYQCRSSEFCPIDNIRRRRVASRRGKGPTYGRYVSSLMYRGEHLYVMMDSHNMFSRRWDEMLFFTLYRARSSRPCISQYPNGWDSPSYESSGNMIVMATAHYTSMHYVRMDGRWMSRTIEPRIQPFSAAGQLFADALFVHEVPFDPHLDFLFDGEECEEAARLWTAGWDLFTGQSLLFHNYNRHLHLGGYRHWNTQNEIPNNQGWHHEVVVSQKRVQYIMEIPKENTTKGERLITEKDWKQYPRILREVQKYGLGNKRSMTEYNAFAGLDAVRRKANDRIVKILEHETITKSGK